ncbi:hypothetical protein J4439_01565 [Candidatus Woesearchaeota archaeon]|nr:hypothetical protein [Candidatus Woesearchaeota archaeon]
MAGSSSASASGGKGVSAGTGGARASGALSSAYLVGIPRGTDYASLYSPRQTFSPGHSGGLERLVGSGPIPAGAGTLEPLRYAVIEGALMARYGLCAGCSTGRGMHTCA